VGRFASQVKNNNPQEISNPCKNQTKPTQKTTTICLDRLQFVKQRRKNIILRKMEKKKKLGCEVGFVMVRSKDYGCGAVG
jgi:hypothetical protein